MLETQNERPVMRIYIGCGLTHVSDHHFDSYVDYIHKLAAGLLELEHVNGVKYALVDSDPQLSERPKELQASLCYAWDRGMVEECDLLVADVSFPSTGLGIELQVAESSGKPVVMLVGNYGDNRVSRRDYENPDFRHHELQIGDGIVTLMALGLPAISKVIEYRSSDDAIRSAVEIVRLYAK